MQALIKDIAKKAKQATSALLTATPEQKNTALKASAELIRQNLDEILKANQKDIEALDETTSEAMKDRLLLTKERILDIAQGLEDISNLNDPVGRILEQRERPNGLIISKVSCPLGVIGVIYESRPNVTADAGALCFKSGNAVILRGGSESFYSSMVIAKIMQEGLKKANLPETAIQLIPFKDREAVGELLKLDEYIDVIVPRGGKSLIERITKESKIPLFKHLDGICHTYIHKDADAELTRKVILNAKLRRTGTCNATETILCDEAVCETILPFVIEDLLQNNCEVRGDKKTKALNAHVKLATKQDWQTEYLAPIVSIRVVQDINEAIAHIAEYSSHHTEAILTNNEEAAEQFLNQVDSAVVMHNASTQFCDGGQFGMGAEIGIATGRLHARGPIGLEQLTTFKYKVYGKGQTRP